MNKKFGDNLKKRLFSDNFHIDLLVIAFSCVVFLVISWYQQSSHLYNRYNEICFSNYGHDSRYTACMNVFWDEAQYYNNVFKIASVLLALSITALVTLKLLKLHRNTKHY